GPFAQLELEPLEMIDRGLQLLQPPRIAAGLIPLQLTDNRLQVARRDASLSELAPQRVGVGRPLAQFARELSRGVSAAHPIRTSIALGAALRRSELTSAIAARIGPLPAAPRPALSLLRLRTLRTLRTL